MLYVFLLTIWNGNHAPHIYVADHDLTAEDCIAAIENYDATNPMHTHGTPSCEIDDAAH